MAKSVVSIVKGVDADKMVEEALSLLGGVTSLIEPRSVVIVKPNSIGNRPWEDATSTSPAVLGAVIRAIRKAKPKEIIMAERARGEAPGCFEISGQMKAAQDAGVDKIINIGQEKDLIRVPIRDRRSTLQLVMLPRFLIEADHIVNVPIFKTHISMVYTCALKNMKGIVQGPVQHEMHTKTELADSMLDLFSICKSDLQIVDMIRPMEGYGPQAGLPTDFGCVVAGKDPVAVDATCCRMAGFDLTNIPTFKMARERGLGRYAAKDIEVRGRKIKDVFKQLWLPHLVELDEWPEYKVYRHEGSCLFCEGLIAYSLERMKSLPGEYDKNAGASIVCGRAKSLPKGVKPKDLFLFGNCIPEKFRDQGIFIDGCPPGENQPAAAIMDRKYEGFGPGSRSDAAERVFLYEYLKKHKVGKK
jgi:uncharacterized protein (DUF362 family)